MIDHNKFDAMLIGLASPEKIRSWSKGEVKKPETINYRTLKPERDGLFCERIFGPQKDWECHCGKYKRIRYKGVVCDRCGVEVTRSRVRRERMGHIELAAPVSHIWYFKGVPSRIGYVLGMSPRLLEKVLYFASYVVLDAGDTALTKKQVLTEVEYREARDKYGQAFTVGMGAEAIKVLLSEVELGKEATALRQEIADTSGQRKKRAMRRLEIIDAFSKSGNNPEWMILDVIPVIPPDLRPMVQLDGGRFATCDLNDLYRRVINRNNRLKRLLDLGAPDIIVRNEKRMLQEAVDALIDNGRRGRPVTGPGNRALKSLSDMLKGKQGRFRQNLLGKRVDYSGRSVIVVGPELKLYQCGLPKEMALELFKPFVMKELVENGSATNIKSAKKKVERMHDEVWDVLEYVIKDHPVLLNRAPTLHRLGIQAFEPKLVEGKAIQVHPLVCSGYNADFDGDQMAVHVPLSAEAQAECRILLLSAHNLLNPKDGSPESVPAKDMVLGIYFMTMLRPGDLGEGKIFSSYEEALMAYQTNNIGLQAGIKVYLKANGKRQLVDTTIGRLILNEFIPQDLGFVDRSIPSNECLPEINFKVAKKQLGKIVDQCYRCHGNTITAGVLDDLKRLGFQNSTLSGISIGVNDIIIPKEKHEIIEKADIEVERIKRAFRRGLLSEEERYKRIIEIWHGVKADVTKALQSAIPEFNTLGIMHVSGARGNISQLTQMGGMRGLMADPSGREIELPIKANFREGLDVLEYFTSTHGTRKGLADTALRTADSGYLTRRLVDVSQDVIVRDIDCNTTSGTYTEDIYSDSTVIVPISERIQGRTAAEDICYPVYVDPITGELNDNEKIIVDENEMVSYADAELIQTFGIIKAPISGKIKVKADRLEIKGDGGTEIRYISPDHEVLVKNNDEVSAGDKLTSRLIHGVYIRTVLNCRSKQGVCAKCYGRDMATGNHVTVGEAIGTVAAQSIGEPGTQLTMRTFHTGGVAGNDITQGLPRVEELFEARNPKGQAIITEVDGRIHIEEEREHRLISVITEEGEAQSYKVPYSMRLKVKENVEVEAGQPLTEGSINPHELLDISGLRAVQLYLLSEVQKVYRMQGVDINDKHIEVIVRQMLRKVKVEEACDSRLLPGSLVDIFAFEDANEEALMKGGLPATARPVLLGITKASLATDSFLSAASFQETTRVLTDAAIKGKRDPLLGLKENVIIGKLIPAGTGLAKYRDLVVSNIEEDILEVEDDAIAVSLEEN
ncbi:DNA-directed RNA polymerase subunit beta' [Clostridium sp. 'deep sea']|uniref:DNA-directed RNA polymerase subunit beta' n=1 Tax=Clostridium sp. 'deep sea' TaxID=2779445 RepID=UPI00189682AB|nr:DNA-directed RNA polymerase subunit beta' [Clostridium sp. 'deep sea']QOR34571.1 DNA-directed RNA polymerase subunit beta' [Clostridium sp. 'deep sea']